MVSVTASRAALAILAVWLLACLFGPVLLSALSVDVNAHGHAHLHAHGHPFADARSLWGMPNAMDVLSNLPLAIAGVCGLWALRRSDPGGDTRLALQVFFAGLLLAAAGCAWYHWAPDPFGLALDRTGMAVTFAGAVALAVAERVGPRPAIATLGLALVMALRAPCPSALGVHLGALIALYALAKLFEIGDQAVFHATGDAVSGHSLKHAIAAFAVWPVWSALRQNPRAMDRSTLPAAQGTHRNGGRST